MNKSNNLFRHELSERQKTRRQILWGSLFSFDLFSTIASAKSPVIPHALPLDLIGKDLVEAADLAMVLPQTLLNPRQLGAKLTDYLMSEKLDGVRAFWDGKQLYFRSGRLISVPTWFTENFPTHPMDGELWMGRAQFDRLSSAVRRQQKNDDEWRQIQYYLFELPLAAGDFHQRLQSLQIMVEKLNIPWLRLIPQETVDSVAQIEARLKQLVLQRAEGLVLHLGSAEFQSGRSGFVYKLKPQHDAEAKVISIEPGQGKFHGMMGALLLETPEGKRFKLGTGFDDEQRKHPPRIGSLITYRFRDWTSNGLPKFASFVRVYQTE